MSGPNGDLGMPVEAGAEGEDDGFEEAERYSNLLGWGRAGTETQVPLLPKSESWLCHQPALDQINSCLDHLEEKNDHLHARLQELLESNRQTRLEFQQQLGEAPSDASP
ncbi:UPF0184 protein C9orf16 homolog [Neophocaena asiaeorientalis asiaeorientalis]|uniref:UPF0184 protein C9orf16 homolog n=1 Tax=Neophocaena asiaeorientalis asiaeorientalis TaxID=1706337 RepID=A0A341CUD1_NEOAA|nr:UPF0184 protein C9orf16 homolog [Neophocaena asiaeorientalis asiaeorientalis]